MRRITMLLGGLMLLTAVPGGLRAEGMTAEQILGLKNKQLSSYPHDFSTPLKDRIQAPPEFLVKNFAAYDQAPDYAPHMPTSEEKALLMEYVAALPKGMRDVFRERLIGFYFIENFRGSGMADFVFDKDRKVYVYIIMNPDLFRMSLSEALNAKEATMYTGPSGVSFDAGERYKGILYALLHEGAHCFDYVRGATPYVEPAMVTVLKNGMGMDVSWDVWQAYRVPKGKDFSLRKKFKFYGFGGPLLKPAQARKVYDWLAGTSFVSTYGSKSWAEDFAELVTFGHIAKLGQPYRITYKGKGRLSTVEPLKSKKVALRAWGAYRLVLQ